MRPGLQLRVSQHLSLTPQLQQSIRLLQLSTLELAQEVEQMLGDNPFLELQDDAPQGPAPEPGTQPGVQPDMAHDGGPDGRQGEDTAAPAPDGYDAPPDEPADVGAALDWDGDGSVDMAHDDAWSGGEAPARNGAALDGDSADAADITGGHESLHEHLHRQALALRLDAVDRAALYYLIESLNDDGYLDDPIEELATALGGAEDAEQHEELVHRFTVALRLLQNLEPVGVGARDLAECLSLQLAALAPHDVDDPAVLDAARAICRQPLELLARRDVRRLAAACGAPPDAVRGAIALIGRLEPRPGRRFAQVERNVIVPDVIVRKSGRGGDFTVQLNPDVMPRLRVHDVYASALRGQRGGEGHQALQSRLQEARWFIKNIQQRFDTILRVSQAIVQRQKNFFVHGELAMRPLVLRDIADELGLHESTISRVTTAKYMATPQGTFELKYFFGSGLGTETGGNASSTAVRALIKQFVGAENPAKPLSDSQIADMLKEQGIECARRTVAKYREALKIAPANLRKAL